MTKVKLLKVTPSQLPGQRSFFVTSIVPARHLAGQVAIQTISNQLFGISTAISCSYDLGPFVFDPQQDGVCCW